MMKTLALLLSATAVGAPLALARGDGDECQAPESTCESTCPTTDQECPEASEPDAEAAWLADLAQVLEEGDRADAQDTCAAAEQACAAQAEAAVAQVSAAQARAQAAEARQSALAAARADWRLATASAPRAQADGERALLEARLRQLEAQLTELTRELEARRANARAPEAPAPARGWFSSDAEGGNAFFSGEEEDGDNDFFSADGEGLERYRFFVRGGESGEPHEHDVTIEGRDGAHELFFSDEDSESVNTFTIETDEDGRFVFAGPDGEDHGVFVFNGEPGTWVMKGAEHEGEAHEGHAQGFTLRSDAGGRIVWSTGDGDAQELHFGEGQDGEPHGIFVIDGQHGAHGAHDAHDATDAHEVEVHVNGAPPHGLPVAPHAPHAPRAPGTRPAPAAPTAPAPQVWFGGGQGGAQRGFSFRTDDAPAPAAELGPELAELTELLQAMRGDLRELREEMRDLRQDVARLRKAGSAR